MTTQSPSMASQATAELPRLPESEFCAWMQDDRVMNAFPWGVGDPAKWDRDGHWAAKHFRREPLFTADQMNAHYLAGIEAGRASRAQSEGWMQVPIEPTIEMLRACNNGPGQMVLTNREIWEAMVAVCLMMGRQA